MDTYQTADHYMKHSRINERFTDPWKGLVVLAQEEQAQSINEEMTFPTEDLSTSLITLRPSFSVLLTDLALYNGGTWLRLATQLRPEGIMNASPARCRFVATEKRHDKGSTKEVSRARGGSRGSTAKYSHSPR